MYSTSSETSTPPPDTGKYIRIGIVALIGIVAFVLVSSQAVTLFMNVEEFADLFITPLYFALISALILSVIAMLVLTDIAMPTTTAIAMIVKILT